MWPIDTGPPPYQPPPSYYNSSAFALDPLENDPFDTSKLYQLQNSQTSTYNNLLSPSSSTTNLPNLNRLSDPVISLNNVLPSNSTFELSQTLNRSSPRKPKTNTNYVQSDITKRNFNFPLPEKDTNIAVSKSIPVVQKDIAMAVGQSNLESDLSLMKLDDSPAKKQIDETFLADLEKLLLEKDTSSHTADNIPILEPPPQHTKNMKKSTVGNGLAKVENGKNYPLEI